MQTSLECLYCHQSAEHPIGAEPDKRRAGKCPECGGAHHVWCWHVHGGCSRLNCLCNPKTRIHGAIPFEPSRVHELPVISEGPEKPHLHSDRWTAFDRFEAEYKTQSHRRIAAAWNQELFEHFQPADPFRADANLAKKCVESLDRLVTEYRHRHWEIVVDLYESWREHWDSCKDFIEGFQGHVDEARRQIALKYGQRLKFALDHYDDEELEKILAENPPGLAANALLDDLVRRKVLTAEERTQAIRALERLTTIREIQNHLLRVDGEAQALALYDEKAVELQLTDSKALNTQDRIALYQARRTLARDALRRAIINRDDEQILRAATAANAAGWTLRDETLELVREAGERAAARDRVVHASSEQERLIVFDDALLSEDTQLPREQREAIQSMHRLLKPLRALQRAIKRNDLRMIAAMTADALQMKELGTHLQDPEKKVLEDVQAAIRTLHALRETLAIEPRTEETLERIVNLSGASNVARTLESLMTAYEKEEVRKAGVTLAAMDELRRLEQAPEMPYIKLAIAKSYHKAIAAGVLFPNTLNWNKIRTALAFEEQWNALTHAIEAGDERAIFGVWTHHLHEALDLLTERERQVLQTALKNTGRRERLRSAFDSNDQQRIAFAKSEIRKSAQS